MAEYIPGFGKDFRANLPTVPTVTYAPHGGATKNVLENLNAIVVPPKQSFTGSKGHTEG